MPAFNKITQIYAMILAVGGLCGFMYTGVDLARTQEQIVVDVKRNADERKAEYEELKSWILKNESKNEKARTSIAVMVDRVSRDVHE